MNRIWKEKLYLHFIQEAIGLGLFMISAGFFSVLLYHPHFSGWIPMHSWVLRQILIGFCMGTTAFFIITNPWISRSGAHINPAVTISFYYLKRIDRLEAIFYILFQFIGATLGIYILSLVWNSYLKDPSINYIITTPGKTETMEALFLEFLIAFILMTVVLESGLNDKTRKWTPYWVWILVSVYAAFESPFTGFGMNPARTFGSAFISGIWTEYWIYVIGPIGGMLLAAYLYSHRAFHPKGLGKHKSQVLVSTID